MTAGGKRRQLAANCQRQKASYCDKFVAAFYRFLSLRFCPVFSTTILLGDGVFQKSTLSSFRKPPQIPFD